MTGDFTATVNDPIAQSALGTKVISPKTWSKRTDVGDFNLEAHRATQGTNLAAAYTAKAAEMLDWAISPVRGVTQGRARDRVSAVLEKGDEWINEGTQVRGRTFTPSELQAGFDINGTHVALRTPAEVESYYRFRLYSDATFHAEDFVLRRELETAGFKNVKLHALATSNEAIGEGVATVRPIDNAIGKPFDNVEIGRAHV